MTLYATYSTMCLYLRGGPELGSRLEPETIWLIFARAHPRGIGSPTAWRIVPESMKRPVKIIEDKR
jgi:hypothetical protein